MASELLTTASEENNPLSAQSDGSPADVEVTMLNKEYDTDKDGKLSWKEQIKMKFKKMDIFERVSDKLLDNFHGKDFKDPKEKKHAIRELKVELKTLNDPPGKTDKRWFEKIFDKLSWIFIIVFYTLT